MRGICNLGLILGEDLLLYSLKLEQAIRKVICGDHQIFLMLIIPILARVETEGIS